MRTLGLCCVLVIIGKHMPSLSAPVAWSFVYVHVLAILVIVKTNLITNVTFNLKRMEWKQRNRVLNLKRSVYIGHSVKNRKEDFVCCIKCHSWDVFHFAAIRKLSFLYKGIITVKCIFLTTYGVWEQSFRFNKSGNVNSYTRALQWNIIMAASAAFQQNDDTQYTGRKVGRKYRKEHLKNIKKTMLKKHIYTLS